MYAQRTTIDNKNINILNITIINVKDGLLRRTTMIFFRIYLTYNSNNFIISKVTECDCGNQRRCS